MARFEPAPGLNERVARLVAPRVQKAADEVSEQWKANLPPEHEWVTMADALVRKTHRSAHGQKVPGNLRFVLDSPEYDRRHYGCGAQQQLRAPRDREGGTPGNTYNCRCQMKVSPEAIKQHVEVGRAVVSGAKARASVELRYPRIVESEYGTDKDEPTRAMGRALRDVAARYR
jgi:Phage Mu protein F like protein